MLTLYHAKRTRSARVLWLLEELEIPYELVSQEFIPSTGKFFQQETPTGKYPTITDGDVTMFESGAIVQYILERYGNARLQPAHNTPAYATFLQWFHFAESTAFPPMGVMVWITRYRGEGDQYQDLLKDSEARARSGFDLLEKHLSQNAYVAGEAFSAADIMMGFTLLAASQLNLIDDAYPSIGAYMARITERPALQKVLSLSL